MVLNELKDSITICDLHSGWRGHRATLPALQISPKPLQTSEIRPPLTFRHLCPQPPARATLGSMSEPTLYPALPWSLDARILHALLERCLADVPLRSVLVHDDQIVLCEMAFLLRTETLPAAPCLAFALLADEETETTSSYGATLTTIVQACLVTQPPAAWGDTSDLLRSRLVAQLRRIVRANRGVLFDPDGAPLTEAVTRIQQVRFDGTALPSNLLLTLVNIEFRSSITLDDQEVIP
jgi:hypothetical protein